MALSRHDLYFDKANRTKSDIVVRPRDPQLIADAVQQPLPNTTLREHLGEAGKEYLHIHYRVERSVEEMKALYETMLTMN